MAGVADFRTAFADEVQPIPVALGRKELATLDAAPRFFLVPVSESYDRAAGPGASANPRALHTRLLTVEVHSLGVDYDQAEKLNALAITALRKVMNGANYSLGGAQWIDPTNVDYGAVLVLTVTLRMALVAQQLPTSITVGGDDTKPTVPITSENWDPTGQTPGQGYLYPNQP